MLALPLTAAVPQPLTSVDVEKYVGRWYQVRADSRSRPTRPLHPTALLATTALAKPADLCQRHGQVHVRAGRQLRHRRLRGHFCAVVLPALRRFLGLVAVTPKYPSTFTELDPSDVYESQ